jgi:hypothetical protein
MNDPRITTLRILYGTVQPSDLSEAVSALLEVEAYPEVYLTNGEACRGYEVLRAFVEGHNSLN